MHIYAYENDLWQMLEFTVIRRVDGHSFRRIIKGIRYLWNLINDY